MITRQTPDSLLATEGCASVEEAIHKYGLDFDVKKRPLYARIPVGHNPEECSLPFEHEHAPKYKRADKLFAINRTDTEQTLGVASAKYEAINNATALAPFDDLARAAGSRRIIGGSADNGAKVWLDAWLDDIDAGGYAVAHSIVCRFAHDGSGGVGYYSSFIRRSCCNQIRGILNFARQRLRALTFRVRHTQAGVAMLAARDSEEAVREILEVRKEFIRAANEHMAKPFSRQQMERLAATLLPQPDPDVATDREMRSWEERFDALVKTAWNAPDLADVRNTQWGAINAVADFEQHYVRVTGTPEKREERLVARGLEVGSLVRKAEAILREGR